MRSWAGRRRRDEPQIAAKLQRGLANTGQPPSGREVTRLLTADIDALPKAEHAFVSQLLMQAPGLADAIAVAKRLSGLLRRKSTESLTQILDAAVDTPLREFAASLRRDLGAIQAALDLPWTTSPVEGQINRLKMLKRAMYGRAGFRLLRARVPTPHSATTARKVRENPKFMDTATAGESRTRGFPLVEPMVGAQEASDRVPNWSVTRCRFRVTATG